MMKNKKLWIWILVAALIVSLGAGTAVYFSRGNQKPVYVYGFQNGIAGMTDYVPGGGESDGSVSTDRLQPVYLSSTQSVLEVLVEDGQQVKKGDVLFTYDTTLSDITLQQKDLGIQQSKLDLQTARWELDVINSYVPISYHPVPEPEEPEEPVKDLKEFDLTDKPYLAYSGSGKTSLTPKFCWIRSGTMVDQAMMEALFSETQEDVLFVRFQYTENDTNDGAFTEEYGIKMMRLKMGEAEGKPTYSYRYSFFNPFTQSDAPVDDGVDWNSGYTANEIYNMRVEKEAQIKEMEFNIKVAEAEFSIMQKEADSGEVVAEFDGVIMGMQDPEFAISQNEPFMKVSGGGGFYVTGIVSELDLKDLEIGQTVTVSSWDTMQSYEGKIVEIQQFPQEDEYSYHGTQNVSYYPYKVFIDESADLQDGFYVSVSLQAAANANSLYIDNAFLHTEGASSYVFVRGADGKLEKRKIQVGGTLMGSYTQVLSGLTADDYVAFPYGKEVKAGAPTQEGTWENLMGM